MRGHTGSGVTETNCSEEGGLCNDPVGGFISATRASNKHFDPYTRTPTPGFIIQSRHTAGYRSTHTFTQQEESNGGKQTTFRGGGSITEEECVKCART